MGKLFKINSKYPLPQVIINESLLLLYEEFTILNETSYLDKLLSGLICEHIRFFQGKLVYFHYSDESLCIYCYSQKKTKQQITIVSNIRDISDEENNEIISLCEKNELTLRLIDYENYHLLAKIKPNFKDDYGYISDLVKKKKKSVIFDNEVIPFDCFYEFLEAKLSGKQPIINCTNCGERIHNSVLENKKCFYCLIKCNNEEQDNSWDKLSFSTLSNEEKKSNTDIKMNVPFPSSITSIPNPLLNSKVFNVKKNPYNFIEKLQLRKKCFNTPNNSEFDF